MEGTSAKFHIYEGKRGKREQTLVIDVNLDQHSNVYLEVMPVYKKGNLPSRYPDGTFFERRERIGEEEIQKVSNLSLSLSLSSFRFSWVRLEPIQEAAMENFAWRITAFLDYLR